MANRFPLIVDSDSGNTIKELPSGDNLDLRESSIVEVQDITSVGVIRAADIRVNGERIVAQSLLDLVDFPETYENAENYVLTVNSYNNGVEFRSINDFGDIEVDSLTATTSLVPEQSGSVDIGTSDLTFRTVRADEFKGSIVDQDGVPVFNFDEGVIYYDRLQGSPKFLSEFSDDIGFIKQSDLSTELDNYFDSPSLLTTDIRGNLFSRENVLMVNSVSTSFLGNTIQLMPQDREPDNLAPGTLATADGDVWNPLEKSQSTPYLVFYDGSSWQGLY